MLHRGRLVSLALAAATLSCGDPFSVEDILGNWETVSVNGTELPGTADVYVAGDTLQANITYEFWTFSAGGVCQESSEVDDVPATIDDCVYTVDQEAEEISITLLDAVTLTGPVEGDRITLQYRSSPGAPLNTSVLAPRP